ncbi:hypothetical protein [Streptomyces sp. NRRL S-244]|uniref:hypothetical protein n=1 Tax=Streptomyces sp. NRRL S-244 TaxID=1463897 RepID=UPI00068929C2|nr:hypothetical protein [Streptomyces sp. NRRL S-244]
MTQRLRAQRWLAGAAVAAAALSPATPVASAASATAAGASSPAGLVAAGRPLAPALPGRAPAAEPQTAGDPDTDPVADVPHEAYEELAGSAAGVGRERPGRPAAEPANPETVLAARPLPARPRLRPASPQPVPPPPPSPPPVVTAIGTGPNERAADLAAHILPLGTGFALMGLGLGYLGMRLRKGL